MKALSVRFEDDVFEELNQLSGILGTSKNQIVNMLVRQEYSKYGEDPKMKVVLEQMKEMREMLTKFQNQLQ